MMDPVESQAEPGNGSQMTHENPTARPPHLPPRTRAFRAVLACAALAALAILFWGGHDLRTWLLAAVEWMQRLGLWGLAVFAVVYVVACVALLPAAALTVGAGFLTASLWPGRPVLAVAVGAGTVSVASLTGATLAFLLGRTLAREWATRRIAGNARFTALDRAVEENGFKLVVLLRLSPLFPFVVLNYALGLTRVRLKHYVLGSWLGMMPLTVVYVYAGAAAQNLAAAAAGGATVGTAQYVAFAIGFVATAALAVIAVRMARKGLKQVKEGAAT